MKADGGKGERVAINAVTQTRLRPAAPELAEVWCSRGPEPATGRDGYCDAHRLARLTCAYCSGERGPVTSGTDRYDASCAACREDGGPNAGADYWGRPSASDHPEYWTE